MVDIYVDSLYIYIYVYLNICIYIETYKPKPYSIISAISIYRNLVYNNKYGYMVYTC